MIDEPIVLPLSTAGASERWLILSRLLIVVAVILFPPVALLIIALLAVKRIPVNLWSLDEIIVEVFAVFRLLILLLLPGRHHVRRVILACIQIITLRYAYTSLLLHEVRVGVPLDRDTAHAWWRLWHVHERRVDTLDGIIWRLVLERVLDMRYA